MFQDGIFFSTPQRMREMTQPCSSTFSHPRLSEVAAQRPPSSAHASILHLPNPLFAIFPSPSKRECWCRFGQRCFQWAPGRPLVALSEEAEAVPWCWHSPAGRAGKEGAHTQHISRRALSGTRSSLGMGVCQKGHLGKKNREISCGTSTALLWQPPNPPVPSPSSWWLLWDQLRMFCHSVDFKWTQLCNKISRSVRLLWFETQRGQG